MLKHVYLVYSYYLQHHIRFSRARGVCLPFTEPLRGTKYDMKERLQISKLIQASFNFMSSTIDILYKV